jgi:hypothetical protein
MPWHGALPVSRGFRGLPISEGVPESLPSLRRATILRSGFGFLRRVINRGGWV